MAWGPSTGGPTTEAMGPLAIAAGEVEEEAEGTLAAVEAGAGAGAAGGAQAMAAGAAPTTSSAALRNQRSRQSGGRPADRSLGSW